MIHTWCATLASLRPVPADIRGTLTQISGLQSCPVGRLRVLVPRLAAKIVLARKLGRFVRKYPDVVLDVTTDDGKELFYKGERA